MLPQPDLLPIDGRFDDGRGGDAVLALSVNMVNHHAARDAFDVFNHKFRERRCMRRVPQRIELRLRPRDGFERFDFPQQFVIDAPRAQRFVHAADERRLAPIGQRDDARLAVNQAEGLIG